MLRSERGEGQALALRTAEGVWEDRGMTRDRPSPYGKGKECGKIENEIIILRSERGEGQALALRTAEGVRGDSEIILLGKKCRFYTANDVIISATTN